MDALPPPEPLSSGDAQQAEELIALFGEHAVRCLHSKVGTLTCLGLGLGLGSGLGP